MYIGLSVWLKRSARATHSGRYSCQPFCTPRKSPSTAQTITKPHATTETMTSRESAMKSRATRLCANAQRMLSRNRSR